MGARTGRAGIAADLHRVAVERTAARQAAGDALRGILTAPPRP